MVDFPVLTLKPRREVHVLNRHHAIFQAAAAGFPECDDGSIVEVQSDRGQFLCYATLNRTAYICARVIAFEKGDPLKTLRWKMERAINVRETLLANEDTTAYRLINAEGDGIPGLIIDRYGDVLCVQITTLGFEKLKDWLVDQLSELLPNCSIFEKSTGAARSKEGLKDREGWLAHRRSAEADDGGLRPTAGSPLRQPNEPAVSLERDANVALNPMAETIDITERGVKLRIALAGSQKTGLFIDQRDMRSLVRSLAKDRTVLDCCSYVGGFSVNALLGGAKSADAVDYDQTAINRAKEHVQMNGIDQRKFTAYAEDVFAFLKRRPLPRSYDFIILDPPAFAKRGSDIKQAERAYTDLNRMALESLPAGSLLLTCSCSYHVDQSLFQTIVFHAARQAKRNVRILQRHRHAMDHPINLFHPEVDYLKSLLLWVE